MRKLVRIFYNKHEKGFCYYTRWVRWAFFFCGMLPIWKGSDGRFHFKWIHWRTFYSVIIYTLSISIFTTTNLVHRCYKLMELLKDFDSFIYNSMFLSFGKTQYFFSVGGWLAGKNMAIYHNMWIDFEKKYAKLFMCDLPLKKLERKCNVMTMGCVLAVLCLLFGQLLLLPTYQMQEVIGYIPSSTAFFLYLTMMHIYCNALEISAEILLRNLNLALCNRVLTIEVLIGHKQLWIHLSNAIQQMGDAFCNFSIVMILGSYIDSIIAGYGYFSHLVTRLKNKESNVFVSSDELGLIIATGISLAFITKICNSCYKATYKAEQPFVDALCMAATKPHHPRVIEEIDNFLVTIKNNRPIICFGGYIVADRKLVTKIFSTLFMYLVVLTQFKIGFDQINGQK